MKNSRVLIALVAGLLLGAIASASDNAVLLRGVDILGPLGTLWINAIRMTVLPLVISLVITAVASAAETRSIGRIGGRTLVAFFGLLAGLAALVVPLLPQVFKLLPRDPNQAPPLPPGAAEAARELAAGGQAVSFSQWLTTLVPTNPFAAAAEGAIVPLVVFTIILALAIAQAPAEARDTLLRFFRAVSDAMLVMVGWVIALAPIGVFALMFTLAARTGLSAIGAIGFYLVVYCASCLGFTLLLYPVVAIGAGLPIRAFAKAALPVQLIGISSSSSIASLPALVEAAEHGLGIPKRVSGFVLPLAVSTFKLAAPLVWVVGALFVAWFYQVDLSYSAVTLIAVAGVFLAFGAPGVPRGAFLMLTPLFVAVGLPPEGIGILIAVDVIPDLAATVLNVTGDLAATALVAKAEQRSPGS